MLNLVGEIVEGKVTSITKFGAFVAFPDGKSGMIHISEVSDGFVKDINAFLKVGQTVKVKVCSVDEKGRIALSLKQASEKKTDKEAAAKAPERASAPVKIVPEEITLKEHSDVDFEDMMSKFKKSSQDRMSDLKRGSDRGYSRRGNGNGRK